MMPGLEKQSEADAPGNTVADVALDRRRRFEVPIYTVADAARLVGVSKPTLTRWTNLPVGVTRRAPEKHGYPSIPFVGLAEAVALKALRREGVPLQRIRPALDALEDEFGIAYALASRRLSTDGAEVLFKYAARPGAEKIGNLAVVRNGQYVFTEAVLDDLRLISYGADDYPTLVGIPAYPNAGVVANPNICFGDPIFESGGVRVGDVLDRVRGGDGIKEMSEEFNVSVENIERALSASPVVRPPSSPWTGLDCYRC